MFRRIELISGDNSLAVKHGLMGCSPLAVIEAWIWRLRGPRKVSFRGNARFYFTERGWKEVGSEVVNACKKVGQRFRIITVKESSVNVVWKDPLEVAAQPIRRPK